MLVGGHRRIAHAARDVAVVLGGSIVSQATYTTLAAVPGRESWLSLWIRAYARSVQSASGTCVLTFAVAGIACRQRRLDSATRSAALAPIRMLGALVWPRMMVGITEASATRSPRTPRTSSSGVTTLAGSWPIRHVPTG
jgi:hypothetical protein